MLKYAIHQHISLRSWTGSSSLRQSYTTTSRQSTKLPRYAPLFCSFSAGRFRQGRTEQSGPGMGAKAWSMATCFLAYQSSCGSWLDVARWVAWHLCSQYVSWSPSNIYLQQCSVRVQIFFTLRTDASLTLSCSACGGCHGCDITWAVFNEGHAVLAPNNKLNLADKSLLRVGFTRW